MSKNSNLSQLDPNQMLAREHDASHDAKRVILVGGEKIDLQVDSNKIAEAIKHGIMEMTIGIGSKETTEKQVIVPQIEYRTIEVPVIIKETEYKTIEIPVITERIVTIEKPVIITEYKEIIKNSNEIPLWIKLAIAGQSILILGIILSHFIK